MKNKDAPGIYLIVCTASGEEYVGSSIAVRRRWSQHRTLLRSGSHHSLYMQAAWAKHGGASFRFSVLEECSGATLEDREQHYVNQRNPLLNVTADVKRRFSVEAHAKIIAATRARAAARTHCPHGHPYDEANTYHGKRPNDRRCRACARARISKLIERETTDQRVSRLARNMANYQANRDERLVKLREYTALHKIEKRQYDAARRQRLREGAPAR